MERPALLSLTSPPLFIYLATNVAVVLVQWLPMLPSDIGAAEMVFYQGIWQIIHLIFQI